MKLLKKIIAIILREYKLELLLINENIIVSIIDNIKDYHCY